MSSANPGDRQIEHITSHANPTLKLARSLHRRRARYRERASLVEGARALQTVFDCGAEVNAVLLDADRLDQVGDALLSRAMASSRRVLAVEGLLFQEIAATEHPQPILGIVALPQVTWPQAASLVLVVDGVRDPGNLGTLIRSAAASGADAVAVLPSSTDPYSPKVMRAAVGTIYTIPVRQFGTIPQIIEATFVSTPAVVMADATGERAYDQYDWHTPTMLIIGGEAHGVSETTRTYADVRVQIPMQDAVESLNAAAAGAILLFEAARQRRQSI